MNKDFIEKLKKLAKEYDYELIFKCCYCGTSRDYDDDKVLDFITIIEKIKKS